MFVLLDYFHNTIHIPAVKRQKYILLKTSWGRPRATLYGPLTYCGAGRL